MNSLDLARLLIKVDPVSVRVRTPSGDFEINSVTEHGNGLVLTLLD